jgi:nucleoside-diphosphate-sugar epimerase
LDVKDAVKAYWLLVNTCTPGQVYNIGGTETMTVGEMLNKLIALSSVKNIQIEVDPKRLRPSDVTLQIPSIDKFTQETGFKPEIKFDNTLEDLLNYWRDYYKKNAI